MSTIHAEELLFDPLKFTKLAWPDMVLYNKQEEILESVRDNWATYVHAANKMGKSRIAAVTALWFFLTRFPARVITTSSSESQLKDILWQEIGDLLDNCQIPLSLKRNYLDIREINPRTGDIFPKHYIIGRVANRVESFQGHHLDFSDVARVLFILEEGSGVDDAIMEAAESQAHRILIIGNPLETKGFFFKGCEKGDKPSDTGIAKLDRKVIHIDGVDSPNVKIGLRMKEKGIPGKPPRVIPGVLQWHEYLYRLNNWDKHRRETRLHGNFWQDGNLFLFPMNCLEAAQDVWSYVPNRRGPFSMGLDIAQGGRDLTVWAIIDRFGVHDIIKLDTSDTMDIVGRTLRLMEEYDIPGKRVCVDAGAGGKMIADRIKEQGRYVKLVWFGSSAEDSKSYLNARAEMYALLGDFMTVERWNCKKTGFGWEFPFVEKDYKTGEEKELHEQASCFAIPPDDDKLREELAVIPKIYDSEGKMRLPPKDKKSKNSNEETIKEMLNGRSPDTADALALAAYARGKQVFIDQPDPSTWEIDESWTSFDMEF